MNFKTKSLAALMIISVFLLSSCEVYKTLYGTGTNFTPSQVVIPVDNLSVEKEIPKESVANETPKKEEPKIEVKDEEKPIEKVNETKVEEKEKADEKPKEKPVVVVVQDKDTSLVFTFTSPLSDKGEWQTIYGDAGEYTVTVTASDGELTTSKDVLIIVNKKEETPTIDAAKPIETSLVADETQSIDFSAAASDLNKDPLSYSWKLDGDDVGNENKYTYQTTYDSAGTHTVKIDISDGLSSASKIWSVDVSNVNRKPVLEKIGDINAKETEKITITALATDDDKDAINYSISDKRFAQEGNEFTWQTDYDSAGTYEVTVSASDGQDTTSETFKVAVENVNRPPVITDIMQKK